MRLGDLEQLILLYKERGCSSDTLVVMASDSEGNRYSPLFEAALGIYLPNTPVGGEVYGLSWTAEEACMSEVQWANTKSKPPAIILYPQSF